MRGMRPLYYWAELIIMPILLLFYQPFHMLNHSERSNKLLNEFNCVITTIATIGNPCSINDTISNLNLLASLQVTLNLS